MDKSYIPSTGTAVSGGIEMEIGKNVLRELKNKANVVNIDITELNLDLGSEKEVKESGENTIELFKDYLSYMYPNTYN